MSASFLKTVALRTTIACCSIGMAAGSVQATEPDEHQERSRAMLHKAEQLAKQGRVNEAEELARHARKLLAMSEQDERAQDVKRAIDEEVGRLKQLQAEHSERHEIERHIEARKQQEQAHRKLDARERKGQHGDHPPLHEAAQKLQHLRQAAEHLKAAGMTDMARQVGHQAEEIERHIHEEHARRTRAEHDGGPDHRGREIDELRQEIKELRQELRAVIERLKN